MIAPRVHHAARRRGGAWPLAARAQQPERMRRIGVLHEYGRGRYGVQARLAAFLQGLQELGWTDGRNIRIDVALAAQAMPSAFADMQRNSLRSRRTSSWPLARQWGRCCRRPARADRVHDIVDPVGAGFVDSLARPGGNATGFTTFEYGISGKWLELLKQIAPQRDAGGRASGSQPYLPGSASSAQSRRWRPRSGWS